MESNPSNSRPASVDSVNLGSTYSGYYPSQFNHNSHLSQNNIPIASQYPQYAYPVSYPVPHHQSQHPQFYQQQPIIADNNTNSLNYSLNHTFSITASASAAAAAVIKYQQNQQQQQHRHVSPLQTNRPVNPQQPNANWQVPNVSWPVPNQQQYQQYPQTFIDSQQEPYLSEYVKQYYREYYRQVRFHQQLQQQQDQVKEKTPLKFVSVHTNAVFSTNNNQLIVVEPNSQISLYDLREIFTEKCYPQLFLHTLLLHVNDDLENSSKTLLPFNDAQVALEWIRIKLTNDSGLNYELKLILKVITMLYRQNGVVSGLDLSGVILFLCCCLFLSLIYFITELFFDAVTSGANNDTTDSVTDKLSQSGSDQQNRDQLLSHLRQLLMRGQRRVAITFALNNGLFEHAIAIEYLANFQNDTNQPKNNNLITMFRKIFSTTLSVCMNVVVYIVYECV